MLSDIWKQIRSRTLLWFHPGPPHNKQGDPSTAVGTWWSSEQVWWDMKILDHSAGVCTEFPITYKDRKSTRALYTLHNIILNIFLQRNTILLLSTFASLLYFLWSPHTQPNIFKNMEYVLKWDLLQIRCRSSFRTNGKKRLSTKYPLLFSQVTILQKQW